MNGRRIVAGLLLAMACSGPDGDDPTESIESCPAGPWTGDFILGPEGTAPLAGHTEVQGDLIVTESGWAALELPACLERVGRNVIIGSNRRLQSLTGGAGFVEARGNVVIDQNSVLADLRGLVSMASVGGDVQVTANPKLANMAGFSGLATLGRHLIVTDNPKLETLAGLDALGAVPGHLELRNNSVLVSLTGAESVADVGGALKVAQNELLTDLAGLSGLRRIGAALVLTSNPSLADLSGLSGIISIGVDDHIVPPAPGPEPERASSGSGSGPSWRHPDDGIALHMHFNPSVPNLDALTAGLSGQLGVVIGDLAVTSNDQLAACAVEHLATVLTGLAWTGIARNFGNVECPDDQSCQGPVCG